MLIKYGSKQLEKVCTVAEVARRKFSDRMAEKIQQRISEIKLADSVELLIQFRIGRCHQLKGKRKNQYAMDLVHPFRLIFTKDEDECVQIAMIIEIADYH
ncbi:MAG: hypothetical protein IJU76_12060 [Desulfovibrionaceae bacterium]|nr:hypothetical protein [Desulfovibrionaceae bacterium]